MSSLEKTLTRVLSGRADANPRFADLQRALDSRGFRHRVKGGHHICWKSGIEEMINRQPLPGGGAKPYQVKQVRQLITRYGEQ